MSTKAPWCRCWALLTLAWVPGRWRIATIAASNGMGFHSPQECMRILLDATDQSQQARLLTARLPAAKGITGEPKYPDVAAKKPAREVATAFQERRPPKLLPK